MSKLHLQFTGVCPNHIRDSEHSKYRHGSVRSPVFGLRPPSTLRPTKLATHSGTIASNEPAGDQTSLGYGYRAPPPYVSSLAGEHPNFAFGLPLTMLSANDEGQGNLRLVSVTVTRSVTAAKFPTAFLSLCFLLCFNRVLSVGCRESCKGA